MLLPLQYAAPQDVDEREVTVALEQFRVVKDEEGAEQLVDAATVQPGDIIEYRATYQNKGSSPVAGLVAELPIPVDTEYLPRSAAPVDVPVEARTEEEPYAAEPLVRTVIEPDGTVRKVPVPYAEYRSLRWLLSEMATGGETVVSARVRVTPVLDESSQQAAVQPEASTQQLDVVRAQE